jgi:LuxR family maltose regulon positive regulatory protein
VERLQDIDLKEHPWLFIYHSWALLLTGQVKIVTPRLENTEWLLDFISDDCKTKKQEMLGNIAGLKALLALWQADFKNGLDFANQALEKLPKDNWIRGYCAIFMGSSYFGNGNLNAAKDAFAESYSVGKASSNMMLAVSGGCNIAYVLEYEGHLKQAYKIYQDLFQLIEQNGKILPVAGYINIDFARLLFEMNDLDEAISHLKEGIELCQRLADGRAEKIGHCLLARVQVAKGKFADAVNSIKNADSADPSPGTTFDLRGGEYPKVRLWLKEKKLNELESWLKESGTNIDKVPIFKTKINHTMLARVLLTLGRERSDGTYLNDAFELLEKLFGLAENNGWGSKVIETLLLKALYFQACGDMDQAITTLEKALALAEPEGFIRIFVDEGPPMAHLLYEALNRGIAPEYVQRLLAAFPAAEPKETASTKTQVDQSELIEPLSEREIEVLQLIAEGLTNQEICSRLYVALNTVKTHTRNIYAKLGAHTRTQAVARGRAFGLIHSV